MIEQFSLRDAFGWGLLMLGVFIGMLSKTAFRILQNKKITRRWIVTNVLLFGLIVILAANVVDTAPGASSKRVLLIAGLLGTIGDRLILILLSAMERKFTATVDVMDMDFFKGSPILPPQGVPSTVVEEVVKQDERTSAVQKLRDVIPLEGEIPEDMQVLLSALNKEGKKEKPDE